ncbi:hypothetical protein QZH41_019611, partial [Actinostola sp. cb2023]
MDNVVSGTDNEPQALEYRQETTSKRRGRTPVAEGKIVLIHDDTPRNRWKLGVTTELQQGRDGLVRCISLQTSNGKEISRPVEKLYPLEVSERGKEEKDVKKEDNSHDDGQLVRDKPPTRAAAQQEARKIKEL